MPRPRQLKAEWPPSWKSRGTWERKIESNPRFWNIVLLVFVCLFCYVVFFISARTFFMPCEPKSCLCEDTLISPRSIFTKISRHKREKKSEEWDLTTRPWICWNLDWKKRASETWGDFLFRPAPDSLSILRSERVQPKGTQGTASSLSMTTWFKDTREIRRCEHYEHFVSDSTHP